MISDVKETIIRESTRLFQANGFRGTSVKQITGGAEIVKVPFLGNLIVRKRYWKVSFGNPDVGSWKDSWESCRTLMVIS